MSWEKRILDSDPCKNLPDLCSWLGNRLTSIDTEVDVYRRKKGHLPECFMDLPVMKVGDWCVNQSEIVYLYTYKSYVSMNMLIVINYPKEKIYSFTFCLFFVLSGKYNLFKIPLRRGTWFGSNQYLHSEKSKSLTPHTLTHTSCKHTHAHPKTEVWSLSTDCRMCLSFSLYHTDQRGINELLSDTTHSTGLTVWYYWFFFSLRNALPKPS